VLIRPSERLSWSIFIVISATVESMNRRLHYFHVEPPRLEYNAAIPT
jgi:hypothetical protein